MDRATHDHIFPSSVIRLRLDYRQHLQSSYFSLSLILCQLSFTHGPLKTGEPGFEAIHAKVAWPRTESGPCGPTRAGLDLGVEGIERTAG